MQDRFKRHLFIVVFGYVFFISLCIYYLSAAAQSSFPGILGDFVDTRWVITDIDSVEDAAKWGIKPNDEVLLVDSLPLSRSRYLQIWHRFTARESVTIKKTDGTVHQFLLRPTWAKAIINYLTFIAVGLAFLTLGSLALLFHRNRFSIRKVYVFCLIASAIVLSSKATSYTITLARDIEVTGIIIALPLLANILGIFPKRRHRLGAQDLFALLPSIFILCSYYLWTRLLWQYVDLFNFHRTIVLIYLLIWFSGCLFHLSLQLYKAKLARFNTRRALIALFISLVPLLTLSVIPTLVNGFPIVNFDYTVILIIPVLLSIWYMLKVKF